MALIVGICGIEEKRTGKQEREKSVGIIVSPRLCVETRAGKEQYESDRLFVQKDEKRKMKKEKQKKC